MCEKNCSSLLKRQFEWGCSRIKKLSPLQYAEYKMIDNYIHI